MPEVLKTDGRGILAGDYLNQNRPLTRQDWLEDCFPEFETNPYYYEKYDDDIKDLVELHMANPNKFLKATMKMDAL